MIIQTPNGPVKGITLVDENGEQYNASGGAGTGDASAANQLDQIDLETAILAKITSDPATQTTLAAILAKIIAAPSTEAKQDALIALLPAALTGSGNLKAAVLEALPAGTNLLGKMGVDQTTSGTTNAVYPLETSDLLSLTLTLDTSAYASGDVLAATQELAGVTRNNAGTARLESLMVIDKDDQKQGMTIVFFKTNVALGTENAAPSIADADAVEYLGHVKIAAADYIDMGGVAVAMPVDSPLIPFVLKAGADSTSVFVAVISDGTGTYTGSGVVLNIGIVRM